MKKTVIRYSLESEKPMHYEDIGKVLGSGDAFKYAIDKILRKLRDETYEWLMIEGTGVAGGATPKGGVPVWQGDPSKTTFYPGALRDAHNKESDGNLRKAITVNNYLFYAPAVINGHARAAPNKYHERALQKARDNSDFQAWLDEYTAKLLENKR